MPATLVLDLRKAPPWNLSRDRRQVADRFMDRDVAQTVFSLPAIEDRAVTTTLARVTDHQSAERQYPDRRPAQKERPEGVAFRDVFAPMVLELPNVRVVRV